MHVPLQVARVLARLENEGFPAYVVGGCVRDTLMGIAPHDWDVACAALPAQVAKLFSDARIVETGLRHGTLTIIFPEGSVEVTTFRSDGEYLDGRHPERVRFVATIEEDLARRDFTMNALAFNERAGFIDPFKGRQDIADRVVRAVGDPDQRLQEDALRIMRALRFAAVLGFAIDEGLARSIHENRLLLTRIASERIANELLKMLVGSYILAVLLAYPDVFAVFLPEITATVGHDQKSLYHRYDIWEHTARAVAAAKPDPLIRLALLMHDLGKPDSFFVGADGRGHFYGHDERGEEIARVRLKALRFSNEMLDQVATAVRDHQKPLAPDTMLRWLNRLGERRLRMLIEVKRGDLAAHADNVVAPGLARLALCEDRLNELIEEQACFRRRDLAINGNDLKAQGFKEGKEIGRILALLLDAVIEGSVENTPDALLAALNDLPVA